MTGATKCDARKRLLVSEKWEEDAICKDEKRGEEELNEMRLVF